MKEKSHEVVSSTKGNNPFDEMLDLQIKGLRKLLNDRVSEVLEYEDEEEYE